MVNGGIKIGRIFGIDISLDYSWFVIFGLITFGLSFALFPRLIPGLSTAEYLIVGGITSLLFFASVLFHEMMHSIVAKSYGMNIEGIRLMIFGGVSQLEEEPHSPGVEFKMAFAGPLSSIVLGILFTALFFVGRSLGLSPVINQPALWLGSINLLLGVFNLLPGFPLDGGRVLRSAVWYFTGNLRRATGIAAGFGKGLSYAMIVLGIAGIFLGDLNLLWFILIGWYLLRAAEAGYQQVIFDQAIEGLEVGQAMTYDPETVRPDLNIESLVKDHFMKNNWVAYPVVEDEHVEGVITINSIKDVPRRSWPRKFVKDVMRPLSTDIVATPDSQLSDVMPKLNGRAEGRLLIMKGGRLVGILTRVDVAKAAVRRLRFEENRRAA